MARPFPFSPCFEARIKPMMERASPATAVMPQQKIDTMDMIKPMMQSTLVGL